jgi:hypothetical protein
MGLLMDGTGSESFVQQRIPTAGTLSQFAVRASADAGSSTDAYVITVRKNGASQAVTCTITSSSNICNDASHTATFAAGDLISIQIDGQNSPDTINFHWTAEYVSN